MPAAPRSRRAAGVALLSAGLVAAGPATGAAHAADRPEIALTAGESTPGPLAGSEHALIIGGSTIANPPPAYVQTLTDLFLAPQGFTGEAEGLYTPEGLYPLTGPKSLMLDESLAQGDQILFKTIMGYYNDHEISAEHPLTVVGWSQSAIIASQVMPELAKAGVPSQDVHFVLLGDVTAPDGGFLTRFHIPIDGHDPQVPALGIDFTGATASNLYPTDVYTTEYDLFADFPRYPLNFLSDLNAYLGLIAHASYPALTPADLSTAVELPTAAADSLTHYYMIPAQTLPLLEPLQLLPVVGKPLYDLLEPDTRILVNLGYGDIEHGWDQGPADVETHFGLFPQHLDWGQVATALAEGVPAGIKAAAADLADPHNYQLSSVLDGPLPTMLVGLMHALGFTDATAPDQLNSLAEVLTMAGKGLEVAAGFPTTDATIFTSSPEEIVNALTGTAAFDYATLLPIADTVTTLLATVPTVLGSFAVQELAQGDIVGAIGEPLAAGMALVPFAALFGTVIPVGEALAGTAVNLAELAGLGLDW